jgi:hypothetical protein
MHYIEESGRRQRPAVSLRAVAATLAALVLLPLLIAGCTGGRNDAFSNLPVGANPGGGSLSAILGTWSGRLTRTSTRLHGNPEHILTIQFRPGSGGTNTFSGTIRLDIPLGGTLIAQAYGIISGTLNPVTNQVNMTMTFFVDENGNPSSTGRQVTATGNLSELQGNITGTYTTPGEEGMLDIRRVTTAAQPNVNVTGRWTGDPAGSQGFQLINPVSGAAVGARGAMSIDYQQTSDNRVTATITAPNPNGQPFTATGQGSVTGNLVLVTGRLPANAGPITLGPGIPPIPLEGRSFTYDALVSPQGGKTIQSGRLRVRFQDLLNDPFVMLFLAAAEVKLEDRAGYLDIGTFDVTLNAPTGGGGTTGGVNLPIR